MKVNFTTDEARIRSVLCHPEIYETIGGDIKPPIEEYEIDQSALYVMDEDDIGCFILHQNGSSDWWCHVQVLPEHRDKSVEFGRTVIDFTFREIPDCIKLVAQIPVCYPNVVEFAISQGFDLEGMNADSYVKDGEVLDQYYLGLRKE